MAIRPQHGSPTEIVTPTSNPGAEATEPTGGAQGDRSLRQPSAAPGPMAAWPAVIRRRLGSQKKRDNKPSSEQRPFVRPKQNSPLLALPPELQIQVASYLSYPDALALKHTCASFYSWVNTGVRLKVDWLVYRRSLHLECPNDRRCDLGSDLRFCRGSVR